MVHAGNVNDGSAGRWPDRTATDGSVRGLPSMTDTIAYKVLTADDLAALNSGVFKGAPIDLADGFIHLSTASQLTETVERHFSGKHNLTIAAVDLVRLGDAVRWEPSRGGQLFPHLYAPLAEEEVVARCPLERKSDGTVRLPEMSPKVQVDPT
jgi:uncharacterized protein (DUF952 family)